MAVFLDPLLSEPISKLSDAIIYVARTTANFKPQLNQLKSTLDRINTHISRIVELNLVLERTESNMFVHEIQDAETLVRKCLGIKSYSFKRYTYSRKLTDANNKLLRFFQIEVQAEQWRDAKETLVIMNDLKEMVRLSLIKSSSGSLSMSSSIGHAGRETIVRGKLGWGVPKFRGIVLFKEQLAKLKTKVLADDDGGSVVCDDSFDDRSVLVVSALAGSGKTTLVTMLCHDPEIQAKFRENIFFVTVSKTPNFTVIVNDLFNLDPIGQQVQFQSDEDAKNKLENFLCKNVSGPMLLVLDDVWSESFIVNFGFGIKGYKILVTSRTAFPEYGVFQFDPPSNEDARILFCHSTFTEDRSKPSPTIDNDLVNQMIECCKKHLLTLSIVGRSLNGKDESVWRLMLQTFSRAQSIVSSNKDVLDRLERSFEALDEKSKECYLDFGFFPEDQRIPASALLNMWVHLYNHDDEGNETRARIFELSYRNFVNLKTKGLKEDSSAVVNYCDRHFVTQHDLLRELAILLNSKQAIAKRKRLIINEQGEDVLASIEQVQEPMQARILSISTEGSSSSRLCNMKVPGVEVLVLNLMSGTYTLPPFLKEMQKLKILNITNYGLCPTEFENVHLLGCLSNLTRIRLERVAISSLSTSILTLVNLLKLSFIMCKVGNAFEKLGCNTPNVWPRLVEIEMDYCQDLVGFPGIFCSSVNLKKLNITNCNEMCELSEEFGKLSNLETLSLRSCTKLGKLPESITRLKKLSILDISDCLSLSELPEQIGKLGGLRTIYMKGCTGILELPPSVVKLSHTQVVCNEEISYQWKEFPKVKINLVNEDKLASFMKITEE